VSVHKSDRSWSVSHYLPPFAAKAERTKASLAAKDAAPHPLAEVGK
jgi:hypothetical protein